MATKHGTGNLQRGILECPKHAQSATDPHSSDAIPYLPAAHCTLIALWCATLRWPFNAVSDPLYASEVQMLCPGTKLPSPSTISCDVIALYEDGSKIVRQHFSVSRDIPGDAILTHKPEICWCHTSCHQWLDISIDGKLPWDCYHMVF